MNRTIVGLAAIVAAAASSPAVAQDEGQDAAAMEAGSGEADGITADDTAIEAASTEVPFQLPMQQRSVGNAFLPANTEVLLRVNQDVTTKGKTWKEGDTFNMTVVNDVMLGKYVVIPRGSKGVGRIAWLTNKGAFGKSGKMDVELEYVEVGDRKIALDGQYRQEGEGNTIATVGGVVVAGPFAAFITGKSGLIPQGRELTATTESDLPLAIPASEIDLKPAPVADLATEGADAETTGEDTRSEEAASDMHVNEVVDEAAVIAAADVEE